MSGSLSVMPLKNWYFSRHGIIRTSDRLNILVSSCKLLFTSLVSLAENFISTSTNNQILTEVKT